jgi:hypothetical protein
MTANLLMVGKGWLEKGQPQTFPEQQSAPKVIEGKDVIRSVALRPFIL